MTKDIIKKIEGMKKEDGEPVNSHLSKKEKIVCIPCLKSKGIDDSYNQALSDVLKELRNC